MTETTTAANVAAAQVLIAAGPTPSNDAPPPGVNSEAAIRMYPAEVKTPASAPNAEVQALRDADPARKLYNDGTAYGPLRKGAARDSISPKTDAVDALVVAVNPAGGNAQLMREANEFRSMAVDLGLSKQDVQQLASFASANAGKPTPTADEQRAHQLTALRETREAHGASFDQVIKDAKTIATRDPRFAALLKATHLGDHPWVVARLIELGRAARARGELK